MDWLSDARTECYSVQTTLKVGDYLDLVQAAHSAKGSLTGQRDTLKTTTAKRIRERMVSDIRRGAVLPPVVIGAVVDDKTFAAYPNEKATSPTEVIPEKVMSELSIIDGMQRTAALFEASQIDTTVRSHFMRVEFWLTRSVRTMVYRMLVLNTGQVPWTLSRQLAVVYAPLLNELQDAVPNISRVFTPDNPGRRVAPGEFAGDALVELYIAFSLRKSNTDTKEALSDEFSRLDFVENLSDSGFQAQFYETLKVLTALDDAFSRFDPGVNGRFTKGRNVFDSQPARIGFMVTIAQYVLGRPGMDRDAKDRDKRMSSVSKKAGELADSLKKRPATAVGEFLALDVLRETLDRRVGQVGRYERGVFTDAFQVLLAEDFDLKSMEPCWRAN